MLHMKDIPSIYNKKAAELKKAKKFEEALSLQIKQLRLKRRRRNQIIFGIKKQYIAANLENMKMP